MSSPFSARPAATRSNGTFQLRPPMLIRYFSLPSPSRELSVRRYRSSGLSVLQCIRWESVVCHLRNFGNRAMFFIFFSLLRVWCTRNGHAGTDAPALAYCRDLRCRGCDTPLLLQQPPHVLFIPFFLFFPCFGPLSSYLFSRMKRLNTL